MMPVRLHLVAAVHTRPESAAVWADHRYDVRSVGSVPPAPDVRRDGVAAGALGGHLHGAARSHGACRPLPPPPARAAPPHFRADIPRPRDCRRRPAATTNCRLAGRAGAARHPLPATGRRASPVRPAGAFSATSPRGRHRAGPDRRQIRARPAAAAAARVASSYRWAVM